MIGQAGKASETAAVTASLVDLAMGMRFEALPPHVVRFAKHCLLDFVGVAIAGFDQPVSRLLREEAVGEGGREDATLLGTALRVPTQQAALVNGATGHALDFDDTNFTMNGHITASTMPALLALAEAEGRSGKEVIAAFVAGADLGSRVGLLVEPGHYVRGFHATATLGSFASAAGCSHLLKLDRAAFRHAIGLAGTQAAGLKSMFGTMAKPFHAGRAAQTGLTSAIRARRGFLANPAVIEAPQGFARTHSPEFHLAEALAPPKLGFHLLSTLFKYHAACHGTHAAIEAGRKAREALRASELRKVSVEVGALNRDVCNIAEPQTGLEAKFSIRLMVAYALLGIGTSRLDSFVPAVFLSPEVVALRDKVEVVLREDYAVTFARLSIRPTEGGEQIFEADCGEPTTDYDWQERRLVEKFKALASARMPDSQVDGLIEAILRLEKFTDLDRLRALWRLPER